MSEGLKQRIAGTIVLGLLGVIVLPLIIDFADPAKIDRSTKIPPAPSIQAVALDKAQRPSNVSEKTTLNPLFDKTLSKPAKLDGVPSGLNSNNLPNAWIIQVGSFIDASKSLELQQNLVEDGHKAFTEKVKIEGEYHHRVYIGPKLDRRRALIVKADVDAKFDTDSIVLLYEP